MPLTDEICKEIADLVVCKPYAFPDMYAYIRAAADWQLEQVIECIEATLMEFYFYTRPRSSSVYLDKEEFITDLKKAMRPQENNS